ncbi:DUF5681 domain-containing protein [Sphingomonas sp. RB1R13]|uniref:DUF5681 domain-containing protein n=1 Tax=Sphingomonas sp. RB1R13 TaxID=3096159 RepID=UPI002FCB9A64
MSEDGDPEPGSQSDDEPAGERVGYKCAPVQHRFAPGQSGNPKGSSRRRRDAVAAGRYLSNPSQAALLEEADRVVTVRENGREIKLTMREVHTRRLMLDASKGGATAMRLVSQLLGSAEAAKRKEVEESVKFFMYLKMDGEAALKRAKEAGREPPLLIPHPDDIEIDPPTLEISIIGPMDQESYDLCNNIAKRRDKMLDEIVSLRALKRKNAVQKQRLAFLPDTVALLEAKLPPSMKMKK